MSRFNLKDAKVLAEQAWGKIGNTERCTQPGAWAFVGETGAGVIMDEAKFEDEDRLLVDHYIQPTSGAYIFDGDKQMAIAAFVMQAWPLSQTDDGNITKDMLTLAEITFRREFFNPRLAQYTADLLIEERPEMVEASDLDLESWCVHHGVAVTYTAGSAMPGMDDIWLAARRAALADKELEVTAEAEPHRDLAIFEM